MSGGVKASQYLVYDPAIGAVAEITDGRLEPMTERHRFALNTQLSFQAAADFNDALQSRSAAMGVIVCLTGGIPPRSVLKLSRRVLARGRRLFYHWPAESAVEVIDRQRLRSYWRHWVFYQLHTRLLDRRKSGDLEQFTPDLNDLSRAFAQVRVVIAAWSEQADEIGAKRREFDAMCARVATAFAASDIAALEQDMTTLCVATEGLSRLIDEVRGHPAEIAAELFRLVQQMQSNSRGDRFRAEVAALSETAAGVKSVLDQHDAIGREFEANIPGLRSASAVVAAARNDPQGSGAALGVVRENVEVVGRFTQALSNYVAIIEDHARVTAPQFAGGVEALAAQVAPPDRDPGFLLSPRASVDTSSPAAAQEQNAAVPASRLANRDIARICTNLSELRRNAMPSPLLRLAGQPHSQNRIPGTGNYLRTDFWAPLVSGGSYGHTCYQARALARTTENFVAVLANRFDLLSELGVRQVTVRPDVKDSNETTIIRVNDFYYTALRPALEILKPSYLFERQCLGNFAGARLASELSIPYILEYNGSESIMKRSFDHRPYDFEDFYLEAELAAFETASVVSVISDAVRDDVVARGIDPGKVLVNWNAVDLDAYRPLPPDERVMLRHELGFLQEDRVVCFIGTFGGWHGIEVLAAAMPLIAAQAPRTKFLLIGEGQLKQLVRDVIAARGLDRCVVDVGRVPQKLGAHYMAAADVFVSPHSRHMVGSRFFGSPTKLFEYLAYGVGVVASDLEQIGEIMSPSFRANSLPKGVESVTHERGIVCKPGDVDEFVAAVVCLVNNPELTAALGRNARNAAQAEFTWDHHVKRLWRHIVERQ